MGLGEIRLGEMGLGEMGLGEMGQNLQYRLPIVHCWCSNIQQWMNLLRYDYHSRIICRDVKRGRRQGFRTGWANICLIKFGATLFSLPTLPYATVAHRSTLHGTDIECGEILVWLRYEKCQPFTSYISSDLDLLQLQLGLYTRLHGL